MPICSSSRIYEAHKVLLVARLRGHFIWRIALMQSFSIYCLACCRDANLTSPLQFMQISFLMLICSSANCWSSTLNICRWCAECKFDKLKFARQKLAYCYFTPVATLFSPEFSDARIAWAKNGVLTTLVDDFFDVGASKEEMINLIDLLEKYAYFFHLCFL